MAERLQKYEIRITRLSDGHWVVRGYWQMGNAKKVYDTPQWEPDGSPMYFATRKEAAEFVITQIGIPE